MNSMRYILTGLLIISSLLCVKAEEVEFAKAQQIAETWFVEMLSNSTEEVSVERTDHLVYQDDTLIYLFHFRDSGFVFVSAEDLVHPILGYGTATVAAWEDAPYPVVRWIEQKMEEIAYIRKNQVAPWGDVADLWRDMPSFKEKMSAKGKSPLMMSKWDQNWPYNQMAPSAQFGPGGHAYIGCVAVSMAQYMYYYRYPLTGNGSHGYYHNQYGYLSADFGNATYNYNAMVNELNGQTNDEVAKLLYHCAISVDMNFGPNASGASAYDVLAAMQNYFGYSGDAYLKNSFHDTTWKSMIRHELDHSRPMMYAGYSGSGYGHAFNLDGYQGSDHFHFNWGWSGSYDGYYYLSSLSPGSSDFTNNQMATFNVVPGAGYPSYCSSSTQTLTAMQGTFEDGSGHYNYQNNSSCSWLIDPVDPVSYIELRFDRVNLELNQDVIKVYDGADTTAALLSSFHGDSIPPVLVSSGPQLYVSFQSNSTDTAGGFHASYTASPLDYCLSMTTLDANTGLITDGSGTNNYNNNTFCKWLINPPNASKIEAYFTMLDTYDSTDVVSVYDPATSPGTLLGTFSNSIPANNYIESNSGQMLVVFSTDGQHTADGFGLAYTADTSTSVKESQQGELKVYPNPSDGILTVDLGDSQRYNTIEVLSMEGKMVVQQQAAAKTELVLSPGIYVLRIRGREELLTKKIIILSNER